jgi:hypothetical protein
MFVAALVAATGMLTMVGAQSAGAIRINISILEGGAPPPEPPAPGELLGLCLQVRPNPANCISI